MRGLWNRALFLSASVILSAVAAAQQLAPISVDYPANESIFPPDIAAPTFLWRDPDPAATVWRIDISFGGRKPALQIKAAGEKMRVGEIDPTCAGAVSPKLTPEQAAAHTWKPDPATWEAIKKNSVKRPATVTITGFRDADATQAVSRGGTVNISTSKDPLGAPIFYRDVPLMPPPLGERGIIKPLPDSAIPSIAWRLRYVGETQNRLMMQGLATCANCHSFSRDGKTLGLDVDGPQNDKGLYALTPVAKHTSISNDYVITWSSFAQDRASKRFGFMSQVSPDGQYIITSIETPGTKQMVGMVDRLYNGFYTDYAFGQVFYPTRGVLAWYSKEAKRLQVLPGADDPDYVQACAFWSPDAKYLVFSRAKARPPYPEGQPPSRYANSPNETQIQYDLYRIPFNHGKGGAPERIVGASENGMSNNFPKVSPDGKWIVFVQNRTGLLMRPDSELYIVPAKGGVARKLKSNKLPMNSWHSFSPNGRWLVYSSKRDSGYTRMYLTHLDKNGNDSPAILIENATAANRAVNIPEFVNIPPGGIETMDAPATEFYRLFNIAAGLAEKGNYEAAIPEWRKVLKENPDDARGHGNLAVALDETGKIREAIAEYNRALELEPAFAEVHNNLGSALARSGKLDEAIAHFEKSLELNPHSAKAQNNLGGALSEKGRLDEAIARYEKALEVTPDYAEAHNNVGIALARKGNLAAAAQHLEQAVASNPKSFEFQYNFGRILAAKRSFAEAIPHFEQAAQLSGNREPEVLAMLASLYGEVGRWNEAAQVARTALALASQQRNFSLAEALKARIAVYESRARAQ